MNAQFTALCQIHQFFKREGISYAIIGGMALQHWGKPRFTQDIDIALLVTLGEEEALLEKILAVFSPRAIAFTLKNRVCLVKSKEGYPIDISLGIPGYEEEVMKRAVSCKLGGDQVVKICFAEDLIIHKIIAGRPQDLNDIETVIMRQGKKLDVAYIRKWLKEFSVLLESKDLIGRFENFWECLRKEKS